MPTSQTTRNKNVMVFYPTNHLMGHYLYDRFISFYKRPSMPGTSFIYLRRALLTHHRNKLTPRVCFYCKTTEIGTGFERHEGAGFSAFPPAFLGG